VGSLHVSDDAREAGHTLRGTASGGRSPTLSYA
jgi:hypothetical protein